MADSNFVNYAKLVAVPAKFVDGGDYGGRTRHVYDEYTTSGAEIVGDKLFCGYVDPGERVLDGWLQYGALGASTNLKLGEATDDDRLMLSTSTVTASVTRMTAATGLGWKNTGASRTPLFLTVGGATLAAGQAIRVCVMIGRD